jgi:hypothetical protein
MTLPPRQKKIRFALIRLDWSPKGRDRKPDKAALMSCGAKR